MKPAGSWLRVGAVIAVGGLGIVAFLVFAPTEEQDRRTAMTEEATQAKASGETETPSPSTARPPNRPGTGDPVPKSLEGFRALVERISKKDSPTVEELRALLPLLEELREESDRRNEELWQWWEDWAKQVGLMKRPPPPPEVDRPENPTVDFALPRGLAWLASRQREDGHWDGGIEAEALATTVFVTDMLYPDETEDPEFRIFRRKPREQAARGTGASRSPREVAVAVFSHAVMGWTRSDLNRLVRLLAEMRAPAGVWGASPGDAAFDGIATGWAIAAMESVLELPDSRSVQNAIETIEGIDLSSVRYLPESEPSQIIASLLRRRVAKEDLEGDTGRWLRKRLMESLEAEGERSLDEWYLGALALKPEGSAEWKAWRSAMTRAVLHAQRRDGSWSDGPARVRATALAVLCLRSAIEP